MKNRIDQIFERLKKTGRKALIGYITAGFPERDDLPSLVRDLSASGLDILELGIPFSDPIADGPTIQKSSQKALENGTTLRWVFDQVRQLRSNGLQTPIVFMSYANPIYAMGVDAFFARAQDYGVDGLIIPDSIPEESELFRAAAEKHNVHLIFLVAPTTPPARLLQVGRSTQGFLYAVSLTGVTGVRQALPHDLGTFLTKVRKSTKVPIAVGFGISTPDQVRQVAPWVDGVIIGSALISEIEKSRHDHFSGAKSFVHNLAHALNPGKEPAHAS